MDTNEFSLDKVLEQANAKMRELAPEDLPIPQEVSQPTRLNVSGTLTVTTPHAVTLYAFAAAMGAVFNGEACPDQILPILLLAGQGPQELRDALDDVRSQLNPSDFRPDIRGEA
jgi:hypothetical protein